MGLPRQPIGAGHCPVHSRELMFANNARLIVGAPEMLAILFPSLSLSPCARQSTRLSACAVLCAEFAHEHLTGRSHGFHFADEQTEARRPFSEVA